MEAYRNVSLDFGGGGPFDFGRRAAASAQDSTSVRTPRAAENSEALLSSILYPPSSILYP